LKSTDSHAVRQAASREARACIVQAEADFKAGKISIFEVQIDESNSEELGQLLLGKINEHRSRAKLPVIMYSDEAAALTKSHAKQMATDNKICDKGQEDRLAMYQEVNGDSEFVLEAYGTTPAW